MVRLHARDFVNHVVKMTSYSPGASKVTQPFGSIAGDMENQVEMEEKTRLINQVLELQHTLEGNKHITFF